MITEEIGLYGKYYTGNNFLNFDQMFNNAKYIVNYLLEKGWTKNAICGMLGNMQSESTINPGIYESLDSSSSTNGYGLVQWTPNTKYKSWCDTFGFTPYKSIDNNLKRIEFEVANLVQWIPTALYNFSFQAFITSNESPEYLAQAFLHNYERPANLIQPERSSQARYFYDNIIINVVSVKKKHFKFFLYNKKYKS